MNVKNLNDIKLQKKAISHYKLRCKDQYDRVYLVFDITNDQFKVLLHNEFNDSFDRLYVITKLTKFEKRSEQKLLIEAQEGIKKELARKNAERELTEWARKNLLGC